MLAVRRKPPGASPHVSTAPQTEFARYFNESLHGLRVIHRAIERDTLGEPPLHVSLSREYTAEGDALSSGFHV